MVIMVERGGTNQLLRQCPQEASVVHREERTSHDFWIAFSIVIMLPLRVGSQSVRGLIPPAAIWDRALRSAKAAYPSVAKQATIGLIVARTVRPGQSQQASIRPRQAAQSATSTCDWVFSHLSFHG